MVKQLAPQHRKILTHVKRAGYITARGALIDYGIAALPRRIADLTELGYEVRKENRTHPATGQRYVRYYVSQQPVAKTPPEFKVGDRVRWKLHTKFWQDCKVVEIVTLHSHPVIAVWDGHEGAFSLTELEHLAA
jgi:hypothetical protein